MRLKNLRRAVNEIPWARQALGYTPNLAWPRTFSEKALRRKFQTPDPLWSRLADKVEAKAIAVERAGPDVAIPTYAIADDPDAIDFEHLERPYVVKSTHASGNVLVVDDGNVTPAAIRERCRQWLSRSYGTRSNETWYSRIPRRIIVERRLVDATHGVPPDFKCWVFHGRVAYIQVDFDRFTRHTRTFFDRGWTPQPWGLLYPLGPDLAKPSRLPDMLALAEQLSGGMDFVRVDLYLVDDRDLYFGEFTLCPEAGWCRFWPDRTVDRMIGDLW